MCEEEGFVEVAAVVDHKVPHKGNLELFWDESNWQGLCKPHHDASKARQEAAGKVIGCDASGIPLAGWD
jgi:5-methylcytosine-specific restriction endonuclease McrA